MGESISLQISFGIIAMLALSCNFVFCLVLLMDRRMLRQACNVFLFSLAVTDMLTGISLFVTPNYIIASEYFTIPGGIAGDLFCRLFYSQCIVFTLGIVSVYTLTFMAVERWYAVTRPHKYKDMFSKNKKYIYVGVVWLLSCLLNSPHALEMEMTTKNFTEPKCIWVTAISSKSTRQAVAFLEFLGKYFLPVFITCATFLSLQITVKKPGNLFLRRNGNAGVRLLRMCTFTAFVLAVCWFPNQLYYLLFKYNLTKLNVPWHHATVVLCMFNSCVNPWVYCVTNKTYRRKFAALLHKCFPRVAVNCETTSATAPFEGSTATDKRSKDNQTLSTEKSVAFCVEKFNEVVSFEESEEVSRAADDNSRNPAQMEHEYEGTELGRVYSPTLKETAAK